MKLAAGLFGVLILASGCSVHKAFTQPGPVPVEAAEVGDTRGEIISIFGTPSSSQKFEGERTDVFEFESGPHGATKVRGVIYLAADVFTLGLAELIFWPIELGAVTTKGRAVVTYGPDNKVETIKVTRLDGSPWVSEEEAIAGEEFDTY